MLSTPRERILDRFEVRREDGTRLPPEELPGRHALQGRTARLGGENNRSPLQQNACTAERGEPMKPPAADAHEAPPVFHHIAALRRSPSLRHGNERPQPLAYI